MCKNRNLIPVVKRVSPDGQIEGNDNLTKKLLHTEISTSNFSQTNFAYQFPNKNPTKQKKAYANCIWRHFAALLLTKAKNMQTNKINHLVCTKLHWEPIMTNSCLAGN
jgi:hypothetical protein